jgi:hypothetical protein
MIINKVEHPESQFVVACFSHLGAQIIAETYLKVSAQLEWRRIQNSYSGARWEVMTVEEYNQRVEKLQSSGGVK